MSKKKKMINNVGGAGTSRKLDLPYYSNYPDDDVDIEFVDEETERKKKRHKTLTITLSVISGALVVLIIAGFFLLRHFVFYPDFTTAAKNTVTSLAHDTEFDFSSFEREGQSTLGYNYDGTHISAWETHKNTDMSMRITVKENGEEKQYKHIVKNNEFAALHGGQWYGAASKGADRMIESSALPKLSSAEATYMLTYLEYISKASAEDKDAKITENFIKKVFNGSSISLSEDFRGVYGIFDSERYVKSRAYTINNDNLAEFINNVAAELRVADITVQIAFRNWADMNMFEGTKTFSEMLEELEKYADEIKAQDPFTMILEVCYAGQNLSAILMENSTTISDSETEKTQLVADFYSNGAKIRTEKKIVNTDGVERDNTFDEIQITVEESDTAASYRVHMNTDGVNTDIKLMLNNADNTFELVAFCENTEAFKATGLYSDTKEQFDLKVTNVVRNGQTDTDFQLAVTCYYKTADIEMTAYKDILTMSEGELRALKENLFDWEMKLPEDEEELESEINKFFGLDKLIEDAKAELKKQEESSKSESKK